MYRLGTGCGEEASPWRVSFTIATLTAGCTVTARPGGCHHRRLRTRGDQVSASLTRTRPVVQVGKHSPGQLGPRRQTLRGPYGKRWCRSFWTRRLLYTLSGSRHLLERRIGVSFPGFCRDVRTRVHTRQRPGRRPAERASERGQDPPAPRQATWRDGTSRVAGEGRTGRVAGSLPSPPVRPARRHFVSTASYSRASAASVLR